MATVNPLLQQIDAIAKEKGVEPEIIISAVQDALEAAARKRYKTEALRARFNQETGQLELYRGQEDRRRGDRPSTQISLERGAAALRRRSRSRHGDRVPAADRGPRPHRRADRQAGDLPEGPRGRARERLRRVQPARRRSRQRHGQALRERRHHRRARARRSRSCRARSSRARRTTPSATACGR